MREEWRNDRTSYSHCAGTFDFRANRVNVKKTKSDFMPRKTLPTLNFAAVDGQKLGGLKNPGGRGERRQNLARGRRKKSGEHKRSSTIFSVSESSRRGRHFVAGGAHWYITPLWESGRLLPHASSIVMHIIVLVLSNQQIVCIDGLIVYFTMFYTPIV